MHIALDFDEVVTIDDSAHRPRTVVKIGFERAGAS
jgi:hypothetical protein